MARKHIALNEDQRGSFKEAKLRMQNLDDDPDLDDNETVARLAEYYLETTEKEE